MDKLILKILISVSIVLMVFIIYLGTTDFIVGPKIVESEYLLEK